MQEKLFQEFPFLWAIDGGYSSSLQIVIDTAYGPIFSFDCALHYDHRDGHSVSIWYAVVRGKDETRVVQLTRPENRTNFADLLIEQLGLLPDRVLDPDFNISHLVRRVTSERYRSTEYTVLRPAKGYTILGLVKSRAVKYSFPLAA
jgi:hypothetical protein